MDAAPWFLQIPPNPRNASPSPSTVSGLSSLFLRSSVRRSRPHDEEPEQSRRVSWSPHVEVRQLTSPSVTWNTHVEVFIVPARERAPDDCDPHCVSPARDCDRSLESVAELP